MNFNVLKSEYPIIEQMTSIGRTLTEHSAEAEVARLEKIFLNRIRRSKTAMIQEKSFVERLTAYPHKEELLKLYRGYYGNHSVSIYANREDEILGVITYIHTPKNVLRIKDLQNPLSSYEGDSDNIAPPYYRKGYFAHPFEIYLGDRNERNDHFSSEELSHIDILLSKEKEDSPFSHFLQKLRNRHIDSKY